MSRLRHLRGLTHVPNHFHLRRIRDMQRNRHMRERSDMPRCLHLTGIPHMHRVNDLRRHLAHVHTRSNLLDVPNVRGQLYVQDDNLRDIGNLWRVYDLQLVQHMPELADLRGPDHLHDADLPRWCDLSRRNNLRGELHVRRQHNLPLHLDLPRILHVFEHAYLSGSDYLPRGQHVHWNSDLFSDEHVHRRRHM